jgi:citrate synthase
LKKTVAVESRKESFEAKAKTTIWHEKSTDNHEYVVSEAFCHGYSLQSLLEKGYGITDMVFLLTRGELPTTEQRGLFDALGVALCNPGPRHPATRAAMEAAVSKTRSPHLLPISLMVMGGCHAGGGVEAAMRFFRLNKKKPKTELITSLLKTYAGPEQDRELVPGFGPHFGSREPLYGNLGKAIQQKFRKNKLEFLSWSLEMDELLNSNKAPCALKASGLAAAVFLDLGFHPRYGICLLQWLAAPGLLAHGLEMANKPITAMPFVADENYHHLDQDVDNDD